MKYTHQRPHALKHQQLSKQPAIILCRHQLFFGIFMFSSLMAIMILMGFTYMFHEINSSAFIGHETILRALDGSSKRNWITRPAISIPKDLYSFSDQEANSNAEKFNRLREWYNSHCLCRKGDCPQFIDQHWIMPEVPGAILSAIQSNKTKTNIYATKRKQKKPGDDMNTEDEMVKLLHNDVFWNESNVAICPYVILDLGSNRGDTLQSYLNVLLSSLYSPSPLSPLHLLSPGCINSTEPQNHTAYQFDLQSLSIKQRTAAESSKRYDRVHKHHQLDMESYLDLHIGRVDGEADPWMEFQLKERMGQKQKDGEEQSKLSAMKKIYEEQIRKNGNQKQNRPRPEEYCFYGVEGNPAFTRKLRALEFTIRGDSKPGGHNPFQGVTNLRPPLPTFVKGLRPLRHIHFFTETVVASHNGPTDLFLDSVSADHVGSSLLESHKYALMGGNETVEVRGITLTWLLQHVLSGFGADTGNVDHGKDIGNQNSVDIGNDHRRLTGHGMHLPPGFPAKFAPPIEQPPGTQTSITTKIDSGGHLILKIDIEGGEYSVLKEALESKLLCDYATKRGNRVDLVVEFHKWVIEDKKQKEEFARLERIFYRELSSCGVHLTKMDTNWH
mmetsp:Transcript_17618/g.32008  ORF Transcript_17618/g.32008 Transcript_17618/m.32008 type:complete len:613 (-) Transcript_17618:41-1879(-)